MITRRLYREIATALNELPIPCRVRVFNKLTPIFRADNPRFSTVDFYDHVFYLETEVRYDEGSKKARDARV